MDSKRIDQGLLLGGVLLILISSYQLFFRSQVDDLQEAVGRLASTSAVVKTKNALSLDWRDAFLGANVAENQLLYTDQNSSAEVLFNSGSSLKISENSLIKITTQSGSEGIDLGKGVVTASLSGDKPLTVEVNGEEYVLSGDKADVQLKVQSGIGEIGVLSGEVTVSTGSGREYLNKSSLLLIEGQQSKKVPISFELESPARGATLSGIENEMGVTFNWSPARVATLEITSSSYNYSQEAASGTTVLLPPGSYQWKVKSTDGTSLSSSFRVLKEVPPTILRPADSENVDLFVENGEANLLLQWAGNANKFLVEWKINDKTQTSEVSGELLNLPVTAEGALSWRVKALDENRPLALWSPWQNIVVKLNHPPETPTQLFPHQVEFQIYQAGQTEVGLNWNSQLVERELQFPDGRVEATQVESDKEKLIIEKPGQYQWRVRALDRFGRVSQWTTWQEFEVVDLSQELSEEGIQRIQLKRPDQEVIFEWESLEGTTTVFELSSDRNFQNVRARKEVTGDSVRVPVGKTGTFYWRSRQFLPSGKIHVTEPRRVIIEPISAPGKPATPPDLTVPLEFKGEKRSSFSILDFFISSAYAEDNQGMATIKIPGQENAKKYVLRILRKEDNQPVIETEVEAPEFVWMNASPGEYLWQYAVIDHWDRPSPFSDLAELTIVQPGPTRPRLRSPIRAAEVKGNKLNFKWTKSQRAQKYDFMISRKRSFRAPLLKKTTTRNSIELKDFSFSPGLHYWRVIAQDNARNETKSSIGRFVFVTPKEEEKREEKEQWEKVFRHRIQLSWAPSLDTYTFEDSNQEGEINGTALLSLKISGLMFFESWILAGEILRQRGMVFEKEDYSFQKLQAEAGWKFSFEKQLLALGPVIAQLSGQEYSITNGVVKGENLSSLGYGLHLRGLHPFSRQWEAESKISYLTGEIIEYELSGNLLRHFDDFYTLIGAGLFGRTYSGEGEQRSLQLNIGLGKEF